MFIVADLVSLILKGPRKNASEKWRLLKSSAANNCITLLTNLSIETNRVDSDHTAPKGAVWSGSTLFRLHKHFSRREKQMTFVTIGALRVKSYSYYWILRLNYPVFSHQGNSGLWLCILVEKLILSSLQKFAKYRFGESLVNSIHLSQRHSFGPEGYYVCAGSLEMN